MSFNGSLIDLMFKSSDSGMYLNTVVFLLIAFCYSNNLFCRLWYSVALCVGVLALWALKEGGLLLSDVLFCICKHMSFYENRSR